MGYVYFICEKNSRGRFKIGRTVKHPDLRMRELQTGNPRKLSMYGWITVSDNVALEAFFHKYFARQRGLGEWFKVSPRQIEKAVAAAYAEHSIQNVQLPTTCCCWF